jgi:hypothetical protein
MYVRRPWRIAIQINVERPLIGRDRRVQRGCAGGVLTQPGQAVFHALRICLGLFAGCYRAKNQRNRFVKWSG